MVYVLCTDGSKGIDDPEISGEELIRITKGGADQRRQGPGTSRRGFSRATRTPCSSPAWICVVTSPAQIRRYRPRPASSARTPSATWWAGVISAIPTTFAAGEATLAAVYPTARDRLTFPELLREGLEPHKVPELWIMDRQNADQYVDVTEQIETAVNALRAHASQVDPADADKYLRGWRSEIGAEVGFEYAEAFKRFTLG